MDKRGIPIVVGTKKHNTTPKRSKILTPARHNIPSSPYFITNIRNEKSLLEAYDSFADACFQSHYSYSALNSDTQYSIRDLFRSEYYGLEKREIPSSPLKNVHSDLEEPETPRKRSRLTKSSTLDQYEADMLDDLDMMMTCDDTKYVGHPLSDLKKMTSEIEPAVEAKNPNEVEPAIETKNINEIEPAVKTKNPNEEKPVTEAKNSNEVELVKEKKESSNIESLTERKEACETGRISELQNCTVVDSTSKTKEQSEQQPTNSVEPTTQIETVKKFEETNRSNPTPKENTPKESPTRRMTRSRYKSLKQVEDIYFNSVEVCQRDKPVEPPKEEPPKEEQKTEKESPKGCITRSRYKSLKQVEDIYLTSLEVLSPSPKKETMPPPPPKITSPEIPSPRIPSPKKKQLNESAKDETPTFDEITKPKRLAESDKERGKWEAQRKQRSDYEIKKIMESFPSLAHYYELLEKSGSGTFSRVYKARDLLVDQYMPLEQKNKLESIVGKQEESYVAIKLVLDISTPARIANEIECLMELRSSPGVTPLITAFRHESLICVVQPFIEFDHFDDFYADMTLDDIRCYISELLIGLQSTHEKGIMHRDVKPGNFLYNNKSKKGYLADFGLAQRSYPHPILVKPTPSLPPSEQQGQVGYYADDTRPTFKADRSGTRGFRAPEIMLRYRYQTTAVDMWAVGVILLIFLSGRYPFFEPEEDADGIVELAHVFGLKKMREFADYYRRRLYTNIPTIPDDELDLAELCKELNKEHIDTWDENEFLLAVDLMKQCLSLIHTKRPTATAALNHPFIKKKSL